MALSGGPISGMYSKEGNQDQDKKRVNGLGGKGKGGSSRKDD